MNTHEPLFVSPVAEPDAAGGCRTRAQRAPATDAAAGSPPLVIRGESPGDRTFSPCKTANPQSAIVDYLNVTFPVGHWPEPDVAFYSAVCTAAGGPFGHMEDRQGARLHYEHHAFFEHGKVLFCWGGEKQRGTGLLSIPGGGCAFVRDWPQLVSFLRDDLGGRITRIDLAHDDYEGVHSVDNAVRMYQEGLFNSGGREPKPGQAGNWIDPDGSGRTFYVGGRKNGKRLRVYEKGMELGKRFDPWVRWEVELHNIDRVIPWEVPLEPGRYLAGAYPALSFVSADTCRIRTLRKTDAITLERLKHHARMSYGQLIGTMQDRLQDPAAVVAQLSRPGTPPRLVVTQRLGTHAKADDGL
jgi:Replication initiation factor